MNSRSEPLDVRIRTAALQWCNELRSRWKEAVPADRLRQFPFEGRQIFLYGQQGIFKPKELQDGPLSIRTALDSPYLDNPAEDGDGIRYDFSPSAHENEGLKRLRESATPLIYLIQVKGRPRPEYLILSPVFIQGWDDSSRTFFVDVAPALPLKVEDGAAVDKRYATRTVTVRLHQAQFRKAVLEAYQSRCSVCDLRAHHLLDGAHITPDSSTDGLPVIRNGLSLCALHHRAFDTDILLVDGEYRIQINRDQMKDRGRAAQQSILAHDGDSLILPSSPAHYPDPERLRRRMTG